VRTDRVAAVNDGGHVIGEGHHRAKLSDHEVWLIHELHETGVSYNAIAAKFEIAKSTVSAIIAGTRRGQLPVGQRKVEPSR
jgi:hypothetical protein